MRRSCERHDADERQADALPRHKPALTITKSYRLRCQIDLLFKWIKQHLRLKAFFGTTRERRTTQIWMAMSVYALVAHRQKAPGALRQPVQNPEEILMMFERISVDQLLFPSETERMLSDAFNQFYLFE